MYGTCCLYGTGRYNFDAGKTLQGAFEGVGPKNRDFFGPEMATSEANAISVQKGFYIPYCML